MTRPDLYTRVVLTVIATALVGLFFQRAATEVSAQPQRTNVVIVAWQDEGGFIHPLPAVDPKSTRPLPLPTRDIQ